jgi:hypothetical protein
MIRRASVNLDKLTGDAAAANTLAGLGVAEIEQRRVAHYYRLKTTASGATITPGVLINYTVPVSGRYDISCLASASFISGNPQFYLRVSGGEIFRVAAYNPPTIVLIDFNAADTVALVLGQVVQLVLVNNSVNLYDYGLTVAYRGPTS